MNRPVNSRLIHCAIASSTISHISKPFHVFSHEIHVSACIGIAICPSDGKDADQYPASYRLNDPKLPRCRCTYRQSILFDSIRRRQLCAACQFAILVNLLSGKWLILRLDSILLLAISASVICFSSFKTIWLT